MKRSEMIFGGAGVVAAVVAILAYANDLQNNPAPAAAPTVQAAPSRVPTAPSPTPPSTAVSGTAGFDDRDVGGGSSPEPLKLERIEIEDGGNREIGDGKYTFGNMTFATVGLHWHVYTNRGQVRGEDCEVEVVMTRGDGSPVGATTRSGSCAPVGYQGNYHLNQPGDYRLNLKVTYQGQTLEEAKGITVYNS